MTSEDKIRKYAPVITKTWAAYRAKDYETAYALIHSGLDEGDIPSLFAPTCVWVIYQHVKRNKETISFHEFQLAADFFLHKVDKKPDFSRSLFLGLAVEVTKRYADFNFINFCIAFDLSALRDEDFKGSDYTTDDGKTIHYDSLAEKAACRIYNCMKKHHDIPTVEQIIPFFMSVMEKCPANRFINMYISLAYCWTGRVSEAFATFKQILTTDPQWYIWKNMMLAARNEDEKIAFCCKAMSMVGDEKFKGNLHLQLAFLTKDSRPDIAAAELESYMHTYRLNRWNISGDAYLLEAALAGTAKSAEIHTFRRQYAHKAEEIIYSDIRPIKMTYTKSVRLANGKTKAILTATRSKMSIKVAEGAIGKRCKPGSVFSVRYSREGGRTNVLTISPSGK